MTRIYLYDDDGHYQLTVDYSKRMARYDAVRNAVIIPAEGIKIDNASDDDDDDSDRSENAYRKLKPLYMSFKKRATKNLHYLV